MALRFSSLALVVLWAVAVLARGSWPRDDSLRGAIDALVLRQKEMSYYPPGFNRGGPGEDENEAILNDSSPDLNDIEEIEREMESRSGNKRTSFRERVPQEPFQRMYRKRGSAFRERTANVHQPQGRLAELFLNNLEEEEKREQEREEEEERNEEYNEMIQDLVQRYKSSREGELDNNINEQGMYRMLGRNEVKRQYPGEYSPQEWGPIAFKKRRNQQYNNNDDFDENDLMYVLKYMPSEALERILDEQEQDNNIPLLQSRMEQQQQYQKRSLGRFYPESFPSGEGSEGSFGIERKKRFPVTKRSPDSMHPKKLNEKSETKNGKNLKKLTSGTNEKVAKDLSSLFGAKNGKPASAYKKVVKKSDKGVVERLHTKSNDTEHEVHDEHDGHDHSSHIHVHNGPQEIVKEDQLLPARPMEVKKKSVQWSDYFGLDKRRKKSGPPNESHFDKNWLMRQYYNTMTTETKRGLDEYPLQSFKHREIKKDYQPFDTRVFPPMEKKEEVKDIDIEEIDSMDNKLKNIEDYLVDEALKYTGAHQGDPREVQQVKQMVMSRLATAYSLEKMRRVLSEFKVNSDAQKGAFNHNILNLHGLDDDKKKRVAIKKEKAEFPDKDDKNNVTNDKKKRDDTFTDRDMDKDENGFEDEQGAGQFLNGPIIEPLSEGYMGGSGMRHPQEIDFGGDSECPILDMIIRRCRGIDLLAGDHGQLFLPLCSLHQICYLCTPASSSSTSTGCDLLFLSEADSLCREDPACHRSARAAVMSLRELHDSMTDDLAGECEQSQCLTNFLEQNRDSALTATSR